MALCELCQAEIARPHEKLPPPWFHHDDHTIAGQRVTPILWQVLEILWRRRGKIVSRDSFMTLLYGHLSDPPAESMLTINIWHLRRKLAVTPFVIHTERSRGYRLI